MVIDGWICRAAAIFEAMASEPMCGESTLQLIVRVRERSVLALTDVSLQCGMTVGLGPIASGCLTGARTVGNGGVAGVD